MLKPIQRNHDANNSGGADNAGNLDQFNLTDDDLSTGTKGTSNSSQQNSSSQQSSQNNQQGANSNNQTPEQVEAAKKLAANTEIAKLHGGTKLDDKGNVLDDKGTVVKTAEQIQQANNSPVQVEVDGVKYSLDKDGNALSQDGKVFKTKAELDSMSAQEDELPLIDEMIQKSGVVIKDATTGKPKIYEDTTEGLLQWANDLADFKVENSNKKLLTRYPQLNDLTRHLDQGGKVEDFYKKQSTAWSNVEFDEKNDDHLTGVIVAELVGKGIPKDQAEITAKTYKDTDKLKEFGKAAYTRLVNGEKTAKAEETKKYNEELAAEEVKTNNHWSNVNSIIKKGTLHNITIPEADREAFFNYKALAANDNGYSKADIAKANLPIEQELQLDYLIFKGFDLKKLIAIGVQEEKVRTLRSRRTAHESGAGGGQGANNANNSKADVDVSIDSVLG